MDVTFQYEGESVPLQPRSLAGVERVGTAARLTLELFAAEPVSLSELVGNSCAVGLGGLGQRSIYGVVSEATAIATSQREPGRRYRLLVTGASQTLALRRRCKVYQQLSAPDIVDAILEAGGLGASTRELAAEHPPLRYVTQYHESDAQFLRRVCEEHGLWWRVDEGDGRGQVVLCDAPALAPRADAVQLAEEAALGSPQARAWNLQASRQRAAGQVTLRDYDFANPALDIEGVAKAGVAHEQGYELYVAPDRAASPPLANERAQLLLESVRAEAATLSFETSALSLRPGVRVALELTGKHSGVARADEELFVAQIEHRWEHGGHYRCTVTATPVSIPYRLARQTPRPQISGVQSAVVTGPSGEEIFTDAAGCVRVRFLWDREGPTDDGSSLPVRVLQPNLQGSMLIPRIGWEVWVAFEDGDPDRPFVLGRAFNGKHRPPVSLPENKTMTSLSTSSSPGASCLNYLRYEDSAGRQGLTWNAGLAMERNIANNMSSQTLADEKYKVDGIQHIDVGSKQVESVTISRVNDVPSQKVAVGAVQQLKTPKAMEIKVGSETVLVGGALMEHVGSPADAAMDVAAALGGSVGGAAAGQFSGFGGKAAGLAVGAAGAAYSAYKGYTAKGGGEAGQQAIADEVNKFLIGQLPGGDAYNDIVDTVNQRRAAEGKEAWQDPLGATKVDSDGKEESSTVGGAAGAGGGGPAAGGSGNRVHEVGGGTLEAIGAAYVVSTPATSKWTTAGYSKLLVGGSHTTNAPKVSWTTAGGAVHTTGPYTWTGGELVRDARWLGIAIGDYTSTAGAVNAITGDSAVVLNCGALTVAGILKLQVGGTEVIVNGGNMVVKGATVKFTGTHNCNAWHRI